MTVNNIEVLQKNYMRRMPVEDAWLNYGIDSLIYSYMINIASTRPVAAAKYELYLPIKKYKRHQKILAKLCGNISTRTLERKLNKIIEEGYIKKDEENYLFPYDENEHYFMISNETLFFFCSTSNSLMIKLYVYLGYRWHWKKYHYEHEYNFTIKELCLMMGYSENSRNQMLENAIGMCLATLKRNGFIDFEERYIPGESHVRRTFTLTSFNGEKQLPAALRTEVLTVMDEQLLITVSFDDVEKLPGV